MLSWLYKAKIRHTLLSQFSLTVEFFIGIFKSKTTILRLVNLTPDIQLIECATLCGVNIIIIIILQLGFNILDKKESDLKQDQFKTGFKIAVRIGVKPGYCC